MFVYLLFFHSEFMRYIFSTCSLVSFNEKATVTLNEKKIKQEQDKIGRTEKQRESRREKQVKIKEEMRRVSLESFLILFLVTISNIAFLSTSTTKYSIRLNIKSFKQCKRNIYLHKLVSVAQTGISCNKFLKSSLLFTWIVYLFHCTLTTLH